MALRSFRFRRAVEEGVRAIIPLAATNHQLRARFSTFDVVNPATEQQISSVDIDSPESVAAKISIAAAGQKLWANTPLKTRVAALLKFNKLLSEESDELAVLLSLEMGKPTKHAAGEIAATQTRIKFLADNVEQACAPITMTDTAGFTERIEYEPLGVVANISAWNFPYFVSSNVFAAALLTGNSVVFKPSEYTPLTGAEITRLLYQAGVPENAFQLVQGGGATGAALAGSTGLGGVFFTGSNLTGRAIAASAAPNLCKLQLELGGKDAVYVRADMDPAKAAAATADGAFFNNGQSCCSVERIYVAREIAEDFVTAFVEEVKTFKVGDPQDPSTYLGPLCRPAAIKHLEDQVEDAISKGATLLLGRNSVPASGWYFSPAVLTDVDHSMKLMSEESFGPVIGIQVVENDAEALKLMNDTEYGLTASVYTKDEDAALRILRQLNTGTGYWNCCDRVSPRLPWSGRKGSGIGATLSLEGLKTFVQPKALHLNRA